MLDQSQNPMRAEANGPSVLAWFCIRSQHKHEHVAARHLRQIEGVEVLNPQIRFSRPTKYGAILMTESLFPNYLFARFNLATQLTRINYAPGVSSVVHFGAGYPAVPDAAIEELRALIGPNEVHELPQTLSPGDCVQIAGGLLHGLEAVVSQVMPGKQRVMVLLDFLGRQTSVELPSKSVVRTANLI